MDGTPPAMLWEGCHGPRRDISRQHHSREIPKKNTNQSCVWHIEAGWKPSTSSEVMHGDDITLGSIQKTQISAHLGLWRPNKTDMEEARGPSAARGTSAHPQGRIRVRSSWPERSEGHERSPAGAYTCIWSPRGEKATVKYVYVYSYCMSV